MTALTTRFTGLNRTSRFILIAVAGVLLMTIAELIVDTEFLTSRGTASAALRLAVPILLAGLGGLFSERAGVVNIGLEGMMIAGTWFAAWGSFTYGPWTGIVIGAAGGAIFGLLHAVATVTFNVDHIVSGVAINILGLGAMRFLSSVTYTPDTGGSVVQSPPVQQIGNVSIPFLAGGSLFGWQSPDFFGWLEEQSWFLVSNIAGILRGFTGDVSWLTLIALMLVPFTVWLLWRTAWGLRLRSCGEDPWAAESLGVNVRLMKYSGVVISGALAGLGGAFLVLVQAGIYREGQTQGLGFIGLAALIFGNWLPIGILGGAFVFGFGSSLSVRSPDVFRAFILSAAVALIVIGIRSLFRQNFRQAVLTGSLAAGLIVFYLLVTDVPNQLLGAIPYLITLLVLAGASQRLRMPAADGARYVRGEAR